MSTKPTIQESGPGADFFAIVPSDTVVQDKAIRGIYVGTSAGNDLVLVNLAGAAITFKAIPQGIILPVQATLVKATGTTASNLVGLV